MAIDTKEIAALTQRLNAVLYYKNGNLTCNPTTALNALDLVLASFITSFATAAGIDGNQLAEDCFDSIRKTRLSKASSPNDPNHKQTFYTDTKH